MDKIQGSIKKCATEASIGKTEGHYAQWNELPITLFFELERLQRWVRLVRLGVD